MEKRKIGSLVLGAALFILPVSAIAGDVSTNSGAACRQVSGGSLGYFGGTIYNGSSSSEMQVICPMMEDHPDAGGAGAGIQSTSTFVLVFDRNPNLGVSCTLFSEMPFFGHGGLTEFFSTVSTTAAQNQSDEILKSFGAIAGGVYTYATCSIPRSTASGVSHIAYFQVDEN